MTRVASTQDPGKVDPSAKSPERTRETPSRKSPDSTVAARTELRVYLLVEDLSEQFAAYMASPTRARGYPPRAGQHSLIIEVAPALAIQRIMDVAVKAVPTVDVGLLYVERQYGILEIHSDRLDEVKRAGDAVLETIGASPQDQLKPTILYSDIIENITDQHAVILNRTRDASMLLPGASLLVYEMAPALFAAEAANRAEHVAPNLVLVDVQMIGAAGRLYISGSTDDVAVARAEIDRVLRDIKGREGR